MYIYIKTLRRLGLKTAENTLVNGIYDISSNTTLSDMCFQIP